MRAWLGLLLLAAPCFAEPVDGGKPSAWLNLGLGARELSLGRAVTALEGGASAVGSNPASLVSQTRSSLTGETALLSDERRLEHLAFATPFDFGFWHPGFGVSLSRFALESPIERRDTNTPEPVGAWFYSSYALQLGLASWIGDGVRTHSALGGTLRLLYDSVGEASGDGLAFDLGSLYRARPWLNLGWSLQNLFNSHEWSTGYAESEAMALRLGASARFWQRRFLAVAELEKSADQDYRMRVGIEYLAAPELPALRLGLDQDRFSAGLGAAWESSRGQIWGLDYALKLDPTDPRSLDHRFSLSLEFD